MKKLRKRICELYSADLLNWIRAKSPWFRLANFHEIRVNQVNCSLHSFCHFYRFFQYKNNFRPFFMLFFVVFSWQCHAMGEFRVKSGRFRPNSVEQIGTRYRFKILPHYFFNYFKLHNVLFLKGRQKVHNLCNKKLVSYIRRSNVHNSICIRTCVNT